MATTTLDAEAHTTPRSSRLAGAGLAAGVTALLSVLGAAAASAHDHPEFSDAVNSAHAEAIDVLTSTGAVQGCAEDRFCTDRQVTRAQLTSMLVGVADVEPSLAAFFTDIAGNIHADNIIAAAANDLVVGCGEQEFCPDDLVTREQLATMVVNAFDIPPTDERFFDDRGATHGANVDALAAAGIAAGCTDPLTHFCATDPVTRGQAATVLARAAGLIDTIEVTPLAERRAQQEIIDAERRAEEERLAAERAAQAERDRMADVAAQRLAMWERLAQCESNGNWSAVSRNGLYYGGLQFHPQTWRSVGGSGMPHHASKEEQIYRAERLLQKPWATFQNQWPACSRRLGLSGT